MIQALGKAVTKITKAVDLFTKGFTLGVTTYKAVKVATNRGKSKNTSKS